MGLSGILRIYQLVQDFASIYSSILVDIPILRIPIFLTVGVGVLLDIWGDTSPRYPHVLVRAS
jgi:hypothetical protein